MVDDKKQKSGIVGILSGLGGLCAGLGALWSATTGNTENELMIKSVYEVATETVPALRERVAALEATCIRGHMEKMIDEMASPHVEEIKPSIFGCQSDNDCDIDNSCVEGMCIEEHKIEMSETKLLTSKPEFKLPKFEDIKQHVQQTGEVWSDNVAALKEETHELSD